MSGLNELCRDIGLNPIKLENGFVLNTGELIDALFAGIQERCAKGEEIRIKGFGTFKGRVMDGRKLKTPVVPGGEIDYPDRLLLKFTQSQKSKATMNEDPDAPAKFKESVKNRKAKPIVPGKDGAPKKEALNGDGTPKKSSKKKGDAAPKKSSKKKGDAPPKKKSGKKSSKKKSDATEK